MSKSIAIVSQATQTVIDDAMLAPDQYALSVVAELISMPGAPASRTLDRLQRVINARSALRRAFVSFDQILDTVRHPSDTDG